MPRPVHPARRPAVVTGASAGIGAETARTLAAAGLPVVLGARRVERCDEIVAEIRGSGGEAHALPLDVGDTDSVKSFCEAARDAVGEIEVLVNNAATLVPGATIEMDPADFERELGVNVVGVQRMVAALVPDMVARRRGDVVFVSSDTAVRARPFMSAYSTSKWGLEGMVHALQMELEGTGVRASLVRPGPTRSEMGSDWDGPSAERVIESWVKLGHARHPLLLRPSALAGAIASIVTAPRGTHLNLIEVTPEAPVEGNE